MYPRPLASFFCMIKITKKTLVLSEEENPYVNDTWSYEKTPTSTWHMRNPDLEEPPNKCRHLFGFFMRKEEEQSSDLVPKSTRVVLIMWNSL